MIFYAPLALLLTIALPTPGIDLPPFLLSLTLVVLDWELTGVLPPLSGALTVASAHHLVETAIPWNRPPPWRTERLRISTWAKSRNRAAQANPPRAPQHGHQHDRLRRMDGNNKRHSKSWAISLRACKITTSSTCRAPTGSSWVS